MYGMPAVEHLREQITENVMGMMQQYRPQGTYDPRNIAVPPIRRERSRGRYPEQRYREPDQERPFDNRFRQGPGPGNRPRPMDQNQQRQQSSSRNSPPPPPPKLDQRTQSQSKRPPIGANKNEQQGNSSGHTVHSTRQYYRINSQTCHFQSDQGTKPKKRVYKTPPSYAEAAKNKEGNGNICEYNIPLAQW